jgi:hypothetical protein
LPVVVTGCQSTDTPLILPTSRGRGWRATALTTSNRWREPIYAIQRPSGENAGATPRTSRRARWVLTFSTTIQPSSTTASERLSGDHDGWLPKPIRSSTSGGLVD